MNFDEASKAITKRWIEHWPALSGNVPYVLDATVKVEAPVFARLAIISLDAQQATLGPAPRRRWDHGGIIEVRLSGPIGHGRGQLDAIVPAVKTLYQGKRIGRTSRDRGIVTHATIVNELRGGSENVHRWVLICSTDFEFTERG